MCDDFYYPDMEEIYIFISHCSDKGLVRFRQKECLTSVRYRSKVRHGLNKYLAKARKKLIHSGWGPVNVIGKRLSTWLVFYLTPSFFWLNNITLILYLHLTSHVLYG